ncbi:MAG: aldo/keto reductase [Lachnospiraceae bacterium]|jgi:diketogulonate reductase-like aldo/keto reductase|nr:aldo/keto reductase [Lachnospiraceae bacterium]
MEDFKLLNGVTIPKIGFGTYKSVEGEDKETILRALRCGYRHLDTAAFYGNEEILGKSLRESGIPRDELFITSKIWRDDLGYDRARKSFEDSLQRLGTDYLDLCLIHWPKSGPGDEEWRKKDRETWKALEELYLAGRVRAIGVSNFLPHHLLNLMESASVVPMVDQLEFHPGYIQKAAVDFCQKHGILVEAWSPIGRGRVLEEPLLLELARSYGKTPAQICLRFALQCNVLPLPKSSSEERMRENMKVFDFTISQEDIYRIMTLPQVGWSGEHPDREQIRI